MVHYKRCLLFGLLVLFCCFALLQAQQRIKRQDDEGAEENGGEDGNDGEGAEENGGEDEGAGDGGNGEVDQPPAIKGEAEIDEEEEATTPLPDDATTPLPDAEGTMASPAGGTDATSVGDTDATVDGTEAVLNGTTIESDDNATVATTIETTTMEDGDCPKNFTAAKAEKWECRSSCDKGRPCRNPKSQCLCDGPCGMVCIPPDMKCRKPTAPENGFVDTPDGIFYKAKIKYGCDDGFDLVGSDESECRGDQNWSGTVPFCTKAGIRCDVPVEFPNATAEYEADRTEFYLDEEIIYTCDIGFEPEELETNVIKCVEVDGAGEWTNITMNCQPVPCEPPEPIVNGTIEGGNFTYGNEITYKCDFGFSLVKGDATHVCQADGTWKGTIPKCWLPDVFCPLPSDPENGKVVYRDRLYGHVINYECELGFKINGTETRQCIEDGIWSDEDPECVVVDCGEPDPPRNGSIIFFSGTTYSKQVDYACDDNSIPSGPMESSCEQDGTWTPPAPVCLSHCFIEDFENAYMLPKTVTQYLRYNMIPPGIYLPHNTTAQIVCNDGFEVPNNETAVKPISQVECQDGTWLPSVDCIPARCFCEAIDYSKLEERHLVLSRPCEKITDSGDELQLKCDPNFPEPVEKENLLCEKGSWVYPNNTDVRCQLRSCSVVDVKLEYGKILKNQEDWAFDPTAGPAVEPHDTTLQFECTEPGYELFVGGKALYHPNATENSTTRVCEDGVWSGRMPVCKPGRCLCDTLKENVTVGLEVVECDEFMASGEYAQMQCQPGYSDPTGSLFIQCMNREWMPLTTQCKQMCSCEDLSAALNESVSMKECGDFARSGKPVELRCTYGYENFTGTPEVTCEDGNWTLDTLDAYCGEIEDHVETTALEESSTTPSGTDVTGTDVSGTDVTGTGTDLENDTATIDAVSGNDTLDNATVSVNATTLAPDGNETTTESEEGESCTYTIETNQLRAFFEGRDIKDSPTEIPHGGVIRLRCATILNFKFEGNHELECKNGKWSHPKPKCISLIANSRKTAPPFWVSPTPPQVTRLTEDGALVIRKHSSVKITCLWSEREPNMEVEGPVKPVNKEKFKYGSLSGWSLIFDPMRFVTVFNTTCTVPDSEPKLSHTITVKVADICVLNERYLANNHGVRIVPATRRNLFIEGDEIDLQCLEFGDIEKGIKKMTCSANGRWIYGPTEDCNS